MVSGTKRQDRHIEEGEEPKREPDTTERRISTISCSSDQRAVLDNLSGNSLGSQFGQ